MTNELMEMISNLKEVSEKIFCEERTLNEELLCEEDRIQRRLFELYYERYSLRNEHLYMQDMIQHLIQHIFSRSADINETLFNRINRDLSARREEMNQLIDNIKGQISDGKVDEDFPISHIQYLEYDIQYIKYNRYKYAEELMDELKHSFFPSFDELKNAVETLNKRIKDISDEISILESQLCEILKKRNEIEAVVDELNIKREKLVSGTIIGMTDFLNTLKESISPFTEKVDSEIERKYYFDKSANWLIAERDQIVCEPCFDGIRICSGSLYGSGFNPGFCEGITLPEEIYGLPVTELNSEYQDKSISYIESKHLKRVFLRIYGTNCGCPVIYGGAHNTMQSMELTFVGDELHIGGFAGARYLKKVVFVGNVVDDADWDYGRFITGMFENCTNIISVIGCFEGYRLSGYSFRNCSSLIQLPELKVKHFGDSEFEDCQALKIVQLHNELISMGCCTFKNCFSIEELVIPDSVQEIGESSFEGCTHLKSIKLPCSITKITQGLFRGCVSLSNIIIPEGVTEIESEAFMGCRKLSTIHLPESVIAIGKDVFCDCGGLVIKGKVGSAAEEYAIKNNICFVST